MGVIGVFGSFSKKDNKVIDPYAYAYAFACDPYDPYALFLGDVSQCRRAIALAGRWLVSLAALAL
jgi:hypothetical protein